MKTLILTSAGMRVVDEIVKILPKSPREVNLAHIITAAKVEEDTSFLERDKKKMRELGFRIEDIDIEGRDYSSLKELLETKDAVYVQGGNSFYLLKQVRASGFDQVAKELIEKGTLYIGASAGSYLACPTIEMTTWKHQDRNRYGLTDLTAMNLVPFLITVHYQPEYRELIKESARGAEYPVRVLTDDQAFLVKDNEVRLVGKGDEIILN